MKFSITREHRLFYQEHGYIEFENILSESQIRKLLASFPQKEVPKNVFSSPRDLWRKEEVFHKLTCQTKFSELVHALTEISPVRLCLDQILLIDPTIEPLPKQSLRSFLSIKGLISALLLKISGEPSQENPPFPQKVGSGVFFSTEFPMDFGSAKDLSPGAFILIVYGEKHCRYVLNPEDPHSYELKQLGYIYGSVLKNKYHPLLYP